MKNASEPLPICVVVADDHPVVRTGLATIIGSQPQMRVVGTVGSFHALWDLLDTSAAHVVILDLEGMGSSPLVFIRRLKQTHPHLGIVIFSTDVRFVTETMEAGAAAYVVKSELDEDQLFLAIRAAKAGQRFLSTLAQDYVDRCAAPVTKHRLVPQEITIIKYLAQGLDTNEVADRLGVTYRTVYNYLSRIREKTGCATRTQMVYWYRALGWETE